MDTLAVRILNSMEEVEREAWDSLAGREAVATHGWLAATEGSSLLPRQHV